MTASIQKTLFNLLCVLIRFLGMEERCVWGGGEGRYCPTESLSFLHDDLCVCQTRIISVIRADGKNMALPLSKKRTLPAWMIRLSRASAPVAKKKAAPIRVEAPAKRAGETRGSAGFPQVLASWKSPGI